MAPRLGAEHHKAKADEDLVREIRRLRDEEGLSFQKIAEAIDWRVEVTTVRAIATRRTWRHVE